MAQSRTSITVIGALSVILMSVQSNAQAVADDLKDYCQKNQLNIVIKGSDACKLAEGKLNLKELCELSARPNDNRNKMRVDRIAEQYATATGTKKDEAAEKLCAEFTGKEAIASRPECKSEADGSGSVSRTWWNGQEWGATTEKLVDRRRDVKGLTFMPVKAHPSLVESLAKFSFLRVVRGMPRLRPLTPDIVRSTAAIRLTLPSEQPINGDLRVAIFDGGVPSDIGLDKWVQAFDFIREANEDQTLTFPIHLVNVDTHSDLGLGDAGWVHILTEVIHRGVADRSANLRKDRKADGLNEANWIAYTIANRWLRQLTLVKQSNDHRDLFPYYFKERNNRAQMQMYPFTMDDYARIGMQRDDEYRRFFEEKTTEEPPVNLTLLGATDLFLTAIPDYLIFCHSPGFTPPKADGLLEVFREYITEPG